MEIWDYLRAAGWRKWLLVVLPCLGLVAGLALASRQGVGYQSVAKVVPPSTTSDSASAGTVDQYIENFRSLATSDRVVEAASRRTDVPVARIKDGISTRRVATTRVVEVVYDANIRENAPLVADAVARAALAALYQPAVGVARAQVDDAQARYEAAVKKIDDYAKEIGEASPIDALAVTSGRLIQLQVAEASARATGDAARADGLVPQILALQQEIEQARSEAQTYQRLEDESKSVLGSLETARRTLQDAKTQVKLAASKGAVSTSNPSKQSVVLNFLRYGVGGAALGLFAAVVLLAFMQLLWPKRVRSRRSAGKEDVPSPAPAPDAVISPGFQGPPGEWRVS